MRALLVLLVLTGTWACTDRKQPVASEGQVVQTPSEDPPIAGADATPIWYDATRDLYYRMPVRVSYQPENPELTKRIWTYLNQIDVVFNDFKPDSEIGKINRTEVPCTVALSPLLAEAFSKARAANSLSDGVFDITCAPLRKLWRAAAKKGTMPTDAEIAQAKQRCGLKYIRLERQQLHMSKAGMEFDFGGIVKGIATDEAIRILKNGGATSALIQVGGETSAFGESPQKRPYRIALQHPTEQGKAWCVVQAPPTGLSASTSGNYEQPIVIDGKSFYHIFDPRTGRPADSAVLSVTVAFPKNGHNWLAVSLSTTGAILGPETTFEFVKRLGGEAMFLVWEHQSIVEKSTAGWEAFRK